MSWNGPTVSSLIDAGVLAYRNRDFTSSVKYLQEALDAEPNNYRAKLYLGMSYYHSGDLLMANGQFRQLAQTCTDPEIRAKADAALTALKSEIRDMPEMTCTIKRLSVFKKEEEKREENAEGADVEWVEQDMRTHRY